MAKNKWRGFRSQREQVSQAQAAKQLAEQPVVSSKSQVQVATGRFYTGPIPEPQALAEYERINPGLADRIITMAEKEQGHRHTIENRRNRAQISITLLGQIFGFVISVLTISFGTFLLYHDIAVGGLVALVSGVGMLAGAFLYRRSRATPQATH